MKRKYPKIKVGKRLDHRPIRHTHSTAAGLEDALAVAWDIILEQRRALMYLESRARRVIEILQQVRGGPHAYNKEQPSGLRIVVKRK